MRLFEEGSVKSVSWLISSYIHDGPYLARLLERGGMVVCCLKTTDENLGIKTWNVIGVVVSDDAVDDGYLVVGSHLDGHDISQGAVDPASGAITVMEIAIKLS